MVGSWCDQGRAMVGSGWDGGGIRVECRIQVGLRWDPGGIMVGSWWGGGGIWGSSGDHGSDGVPPSTLPAHPTPGPPPDCWWAPWWDHGGMVVGSGATGGIVVGQ